MYDEFERAFTGQPEKKLSPLGWFLVVAGLVTCVGVVGVGFAVHRVYVSAADRVEEFARRLDGVPSVAATRVRSSLASHASLISADPGAGLVFLEDLDTGDPSGALMEKLLGGAFDFAGEDLSQIVEQPRDRPSRADGSDGDQLRFEADADEDGGFLIIGSAEDQVRIDLRRTDDGGFLTIDSEDGQVRVDLVKTDDGGHLTIDSDDGDVRFDLTRGEAGGRLLVRSDEGEVRLAVGDDAEGIRRWVPRFDGMPDAPRGVYSLSTEDGFMGAVAWEGDDSPEEVLAFYQAALEDRGYELRAAHRLRDRGSDSASLWARHERDDRVVFVVATRDGDGTTVLLGYGEGER
ncbi:MAG: hypothetical protein OEZ65_07755 [Gemmatimonadota bacterium]|nr:hypothetical protein [Gemmatimonadota bacterium]MDH5759470.1 hypothetical protein [Gemmatimonadota bacterium]